MTYARQYLQGNDDKAYIIMVRTTKNWMREVAYEALLNATRNVRTADDYERLNNLLELLNVFKYTEINEKAIILVEKLTWLVIDAIEDYEHRQEAMEHYRTLYGGV